MSTALKLLIFTWVIIGLGLFSGLGYYLGKTAGEKAAAGLCTGGLGQPAPGTQIYTQPGGAPSLTPTPGGNSPTGTPPAGAPPATGGSAPNVVAPGTP